MARIYTRDEADFMHAYGWRCPGCNQRPRESLVAPGYYLVPHDTGCTYNEQPVDTVAAHQAAEEALDKRRAGAAWEADQ